MDLRPTLLKSAMATLLGAFAVVAALTILPGRAGAVDITQTVTYPPAGPITGPAYLGISDVFNGTIGNTFLDHVLFTVLPSNSFTLTTTLNFQQGLNLTSAELWNSAGTTQYATGTPFAISSTTPSPLAPGTYDLRVWGTLTSSTGWYGASVNFNSTAAPIPEPETYAMMLAGLGLMGLIARRRRQYT